MTTMNQPPNKNMTELADRVRSLSEEMQPEPTGAASDLSSLPGIKAVLFDIYGTLFVSGSGDIGVQRKTQSGEALTDSLAAAGFEEVEPGAGPRGVQLLLGGIEQAHIKLREQGLDVPEVEIRVIWREVLSALREEGLVGGQLRAGMIDRLAIDYECRVNPTWPMPGLRELLQRLQDMSCRLGVVSNAQFYTPLLFVAHLGMTLEDLGFEPALCVYSCDMWQAKPALRLFEKALEVLEQQHEIMPPQVLYVGNDMLNDMWPAATLGCRTALFAGDRRSLRMREDDERCRDLRTDVVLTDLGQLIEVLGA